MTPPFTEAELAETRRPLLEASQLPPRAYVDEEVAAWEAEHLFLGGWVCVGHAQPLASRGAFVTRDIAGESLLFMGDDEGKAHGVFNVCRHRGARLVSEPEGTMRRLQCPYHAWCYGFDGALKSAPAHRGDRELRPRHIGLTAGPHGGAPRPAVRRRLRHRRPARRPPRRPHAAPRALPPRRPPALRDDHLRRPVELEGDRRELLRVPALPGRAPRAQPPQPLHERRRVRRRRRLVRRLDDAQRGRRDDGAERRPRPPPRHQGPEREGAARRPLLRALPQPARLAAPRLRDGPHAVAARRRAHRGRVRVVLRARDRRPARLRSVRCGRLLGHGEPPGLGGVRARPARDRLARARPRPLHRQRDRPSTQFDQLVADAYLEK